MTKAPKTLPLYCSSVGPTWPMVHLLSFDYLLCEETSSFEKTGGVRKGVFRQDSTFPQAFFFYQKIISQGWKFSEFLLLFKILHIFLSLFWHLSYIELRWDIRQSFTDGIYFATKTLKRVSTSVRQLPLFEGNLHKWNKQVCSYSSQVFHQSMFFSSTKSREPSRWAGCWVVCSGAPQSKTLRGTELATTPWAAPKPSTWSDQASNLSTESN